jgi:hypothetical protein
MNAVTTLSARLPTDSISPRRSSLRPYRITGPAPGATAGTLRGAKAYIDYTNSRGGMYGRNLTVTPYDDGFDPTKTTANGLQIEINPISWAGARLLR